MSRDPNPEIGQKGVRPLSVRTLQIGAAGLGIACIMIALPLVLPSNSMNRFLVAIGFLLACFGVTCLLNGAWDRFRARRK